MLELIAIVTMFIDHVGLFFYPQQIWMRIIGRVAMPIYAYGIAKGYKLTKNRKKYGMRLVFFALLSQLSFGYLFKMPHFNIIFTFIIGFIALHLIDKTGNTIKKAGIGLVAMGLSEWLPLEYGLHAIALIFMYYYTPRRFWIGIHSLLLIALHLMGIITLLQAYSVVGTFLVLALHNQQGFTINRTFYRSFYPVHLAVIALVSKFK